MGDLGNMLFGSGGEQTTDNTLDPNSEALNRLRLQQLSGLFTGTNLADFGQPKPEVYTGSPSVDALFSTATQDSNVGNLMSFDDYLNLGLDESRNYINQVAKPEILQTAALQGLEGGGFVSEAIAKATAGLALPFLQTLPSASATLATAGPLANAQINTQAAQRASTLFPLADYKRSLSEQDLLRQQGLVTTGLTGLPYTPVTDSSQDKSSQPLFNFFGQG